MDRRSDRVFRKRQKIHPQHGVAPRRLPTGVGHRWHAAVDPWRLDLQCKHTGSWEIAAAGLALACILLFTIGTALGAKARRQALKSARISHPRPESRDMAAAR